MLPPFTLPSKSEVRITLREATVAEAIEFAGVHADQEEEITSVFLTRVQDKASFVEPRTWTAEDRRFALMWYFVNTPGDKEEHFPYDCPHCGQTHHVLLDYRKLLEETYIPIQGLPEREFDWGGQKVTVKPLDGHAIEELEGMYLVLNSISDPKSGEYQKQLSRIHLTRFELCVFFPEAEGWGERIMAKIKGRSQRELDQEARAKEQQFRAEKRKRLTSMTMGEFEQFAALVTEKLEEMEHGLESVYAEGKVQLVTYPFQCEKNPDDKEATTRLRVPFRNCNYVPSI